MKRYVCLILLAICLTTGAACINTPEVAGNTAGVPGAIVQKSSVIDFASLKRTLQATPVVLRMPAGVYETDLWEMGMRLDPRGNRYYDPTLLASFCTQICQESAVPPVDATVTYSDGKEPFAYTPHQDGQAVEAAYMAKLLNSMSYAADAYSIVVPSASVPAAVTAEQLEQERQLIGQYTTSFNKSPLNNANRVFNITKAAEGINGVVVKPGESFSMNQTIGDRNKKNGWKTATAICGGKYTKEYGGGVCQVSSTLFNAVMMANLEITERYHHSWPMTYVPIGRDATISTGSKDFIFRNNTGSDVVVSARVDKSAKKITVSLYGAAPKDYAYIEIESKRTGSLSAKKEERILDESLPNNTRMVERKARTGKTSVTYQCFYDANGVLLERKVAYKDSYPSIAGIVYLSSDLYY